MTDGPAQSQEADGPDSSGSSASREEDENRCPTCGALLEIQADYAVHLAGLDGSRPECARQDLAAIAERERRSPSQRPITGRTQW